jgi:hypothetical protein
VAVMLEMCARWKSFAIIIISTARLPLESLGKLNFFFFVLCLSILAHPPYNHLHFIIHLPSPLSRCRPPRTLSMWANVYNRYLLIVLFRPEENGQGGEHGFRH